MATSLHWHVDHLRSLGTSTLRLRKNLLNLKEKLRKSFKSQRLNTGSFHWLEKKASFLTLGRALSLIHFTSTAQTDRIQAKNLICNHNHNLYSTCRVSHLVFATIICLEYKRKAIKKQRTRSKADIKTLFVQSTTLVSTSKQNKQ